ncbi:hypothetical protein CU098_004290 [Rhizopus stolonifer]|uniref:Uncharacterized protein n=1 Tax=Rhizopus stolonifer TaxID=4846 RepID=A0A367J261_RHIST|nr:hypothetical protein CU098_004290 [Rhizopus stolonifer]
MAALNDDVYARVHEKVKEHNLTEQEVKAIETARGQLQTHTYTGGMAGATNAFLIGKRKRFNPIQLLAVTGGGFLMGSQMGLISGALAGVKTINSLPNPQRLINVIREVQLEAMKRKIPNAPQNRNTVRPPLMSSQELNQAQNPQDSFSPDINENTLGELGWGMPIDRQTNKSDMNITDQQDQFTETKARQQQLQQPSAWDKIRAENLPNNTWARIRQEAQKTSPEDLAKAREKTASRLRENSGFDVEELPRTREEVLQKSGSSRKNQWGDVLE